MQIKYEHYDLFTQNLDWPTRQTTIIPHVCNNRGLWGKGFVLSLSQHFPEAEKEYRRRYSAFISEHEDTHPTDARLRMLGVTHWVTARIHPNRVYVANMVAQTMCPMSRRLWYNKLVYCMEEVFYRARQLPNPVIYCPKFGSGLAGGDWGVVEQLIHDCWVRPGLEVVVFLNGKNNQQNKRQD